MIPTNQEAWSLTESGSKTQFPVCLSYWVRGLKSSQSQCYGLIVWKHTEQVMQGHQGSVLTGEKSVAQGRKMEIKHLTNVSLSSLHSISFFCCVSSRYTLFALPACLHLLLCCRTHASPFLSLWQHYFLLQLALFLIPLSLKSFIRYPKKNNYCLFSP